MHAVRMCRRCQPPLPAAAACQLPAAAACCRDSHTWACIEPHCAAGVPSCALQLVIQKGKLNPRVLEMFERTEHESLLAIIAQLSIVRWSAPLVPTTQNGPIGYSKPSWQ